MANQAAHVAVYAPLTSAPMLLAAARPVGRGSFFVQNVGANDVYLGIGNAVTATGSTRGILLKGGLTPPASYSNPKHSGEWWAIASVGTADLTVEETY